MKIIYRYNKKWSRNLEEKLIDLNIKYKREIIQGIMDNIIFEVIKGTTQENEITSFIDGDSTTCLTYVEYSKKELTSCEFLRIIPKLQSVEILNYEEAFESTCKEIDKHNITRTNHQKQINHFKIKYSPKNTTCLYSINNGFSYIFANEKFYDLANDNDITGIKFNPIYRKNGEVFNDFYQLEANNVLKFDDINIEEHCKIRQCRICKKQSIIVDELFQLSLNLYKNELKDDFYMTEQIFGEGIPERYYIISKKLYRLMEQEHMDKNVSFIPVLLK